MTKYNAGKLEVFADGRRVGELPLDKAALSIGRDPQGDLQLMDPRISRCHARLTRISTSYFIEDCDSTNGTLLNGRPVRKHIFRPGDNLRIGSFELRYVAADADGPARPVVEAQEGGQQKAALFFLKGPEAGEIKPLKTPLFTIGRPGESVAVVARRGQGLCLLHIGGALPVINGVEMTERTAPLRHDDIIDVGDHRIKVALNP